MPVLSSASKDEYLAWRDLVFPNKMALVKLPDLCIYEGKANTKIFLVLKSWSIVSIPQCLTLCLTVPAKT